jgi:primosomal protein N' (replication factor Y) (superfamily II helicase)
MHTHQFAEVIIDMVSNAVDRPFHYSIPPELQGKLISGQMVTIPLGNRSCRGYVLRLLRETSVKPLRDITSIIEMEPVLTGEQLALAHWLSMRCYCRLIDALHAMVPASFRKGKQPGSVQIVEATEAAVQADLSRAPAQREAMQVITGKGPVPRSELVRHGISSQTISALEKKGLIRTFLSQAASLKKENKLPATSPHLMQNEQATCFEQVSAALGREKPRKILLHGITASGKTEIYMQAITCALAQKRTSLIMVPEISLTPQMIDHFEGRFPGLVAVMHSRLSMAEKNRHYRMILSGDARVVLGARSAVFAPLKDIGLIVIDEEHETSYKQEEAPRYHTRDVAWWRARRHKAVLLLGSATPSLESYYAATSGGHLLLSMTSRVTPAQLPPVTVVDMRRELKENHRHIFSRLLLEELKDVLERDEQALLFINRRGFAGFVLCRECGYVVRCPSCDVSLTMHLDRGQMCCHYCAHQEPVPEICPTCSGLKIRYFSAGTQRVEDEVKKLFPAASLIRMDSDTTSSREAHQSYYRRFRDGKANILIGTQMIAKGFDFPGVTLVGVVAADTTLNLPDFRAPERTFQLLTQVSGRTARGPRGGRVIVQTYHPAHYSILAAADHDYNRFFSEELENRRQLAYPPFSDLLRILFSGPDEKKVFEAAHWFSDLLGPAAGNAEILGPAPASLFRIKEQYRVQTILKGENLARIAPAVRKLIREYHGHKPPWPVRLAVDFNPQVVL